MLPSFPVIGAYTLPTKNPFSVIDAYVASATRNGPIWATYLCVVENQFSSDRSHKYPQNRLYPMCAS